MKSKFRIALRYFFSRKSHSAVNIISMVSMVGIALATAAMVVVMSVFNGFHSLIESRLSIIDPPVCAVPAQGKAFERVDSLCAALEKSPAISAAYPVIEERALAVYEQRQMVVRMRGIPEALYSEYSEICPLGEPWADYHPSAQSAVVSVGVANRLNLPVGGEQLMGLYVPRRVGRINPANPMSAFRTDSVAPSAVFMLNQEETDADLVVVPIALASHLLQYHDRATSIAIYPSESVRDALKSAQRILGSAAIQTLEQSNASTFRIVNIEKWITFLLLGFILLIASFNVISSLSLLIIEKEGNAEVLRAMGATRTDVRSIYRIDGMLIVSFGAIVGMILGTLLSLGQQYFGWVKLAADPTTLSVSAYPVVFSPIDILSVAVAALLVGLLTTATIRK